MLTEHNDFGAFALTSSRGFKFVTIFMKNNMFQMCLSLLFAPYISKSFTINMLNHNVLIVSLYISEKISLQYEG